MATKKTESKPKATTKKPKADTAVFRGQKYIVLERSDHKVKLTDGTIHFWVKASNVED